MRTAKLLTVIFTIALAIGALSACSVETAKPQKTTGSGFEYEMDRLVKYRTKEDYTIKEKVVYKALEDGILTVIFDAVDNRIKDISFHSSAEPEAQKYVRIRDGSVINKVFPNH